MGEHMELAAELRIISDHMVDLMDKLSAHYPKSQWASRTRAIANAVGTLRTELDDKLFVEHEDADDHAHPVLARIYYGPHEAIAPDKD